MRRKMFLMSLLLIVVSFFAACELVELEDPECPDGQIMCSGKCVSSRSLYNCGGCGNICSEDEKCSNSGGNAYACEKKCVPGHLFCDGKCYKSFNSNEQCGACGVKCKKNESCAENNGVFACKTVCDLSKEQWCDGSCVSLSDVKHCGKCGEKCVGNGVCEKRNGQYRCADLCENGRRDPGENAVDCGGKCASCKTCSVNANKIPCPDGQFCDSAVGYLCSKKCVPDNGEANTESKHCSRDQICRADGRCASKYFITEWAVDPNDLSIELFHDERGACDFEVDWGDGAKEKIKVCTPEKLKHKYLRSGSYTVKISGQYDGWGWKDWETVGEKAENIDKLIAVHSWGQVGLGLAAFAKCMNLKQFPVDGVPDATKLIRMSATFSSAKHFNLRVGHWDTSNVIYMGWLFSGCEQFNQDVGKWDVSKVQNMRATFNFAKSFNQDIGQWDVSRVTSMVAMFRYAENFNQNIGEWDVSKVIHMSDQVPSGNVFDGMFLHAKAFNQDISRWDVSEVIDMRAMFQGASSFNQDLSEWRLAANVQVDDMFAESKLSSTNYCKLTTSKHWQSVMTFLGISYHC